MGLSKNCLRSTISPKISIDEFEPKSGHSEEVIVVGFYANDAEPAEDLGDFISKGTVGMIDVDVSPNPNEEGDFLIFVEFPRDEEFPVRLLELAADINNVSGEMKWEVSPYLTDDWFDIQDRTWEQFVILNPQEYVTKDEFTPPDLAESVKEFMGSSMIRYELKDNEMRLFIEGRQIHASVLDCDLVDVVTERHASIVTESVMNFGSDTHVQAIERSLGSEYRLYDLSECVVIQHKNTVLLLNGINYG